MGVGLAMLFDQAGGQMTADMAKIVAEGIRNSKYIESLIKEIKKEWDRWDNRDGRIDNKLCFQDFYNGFMAPYFGCYRCEDSQMGLRALDMDDDGDVDWFEFKHFLVWAGRQKPNVNNAQELLDYAFRNGLIPAMKDEIDRCKKEDEEDDSGKSKDKGDDHKGKGKGKGHSHKKKGHSHKKKGHGHGHRKKHRHRHSRRHRHRHHRRHRRSRL